MIAERWPYPLAVVVLGALAVPRHQPPPPVPVRPCAMQCFAEDTPGACRERLIAAWQFHIPFDVATAPPGYYPMFGPLIDGRYAYIEEIAPPWEEEVLAREAAIEAARCSTLCPSIRCTSE